MKTNQKQKNMEENGKESINTFISASWITSLL